MPLEKEVVYSANLADRIGDIIADDNVLSVDVSDADTSDVDVVDE